MENEPLIRLGCFFGILVLMGLWEAIAPRRQPCQSKPKRWLSNLGIVVLNTLILRAVFPLAAVGVAAIAVEQGWGLFNVLSLPTWQAIILSFLALDFIIYLQHVMFHALPTLWRLHKVFFKLAFDTNNDDDRSGRTTRRISYRWRPSYT